MEMTNRRMIELYNSLLSCNEWTPHAKAFMMLAQNTRRLREAFEDYGKLQESVLETHGAERNGQGWETTENENGVIEIAFPSEAKRKEANVALDALLDEEIEVDLRKTIIKESDLERNGINVGVLSRLIDDLVELEEES